MNACKLCKSAQQSKSRNTTPPPSLFNEYEKPEKSVAIHRHKSRFDLYIHVISVLIIHEELYPVYVVVVVGKVSLIYTKHNSVIQLFLVFQAIPRSLPVGNVSASPVKRTVYFETNVKIFNSLIYLGWSSISVLLTVLETHFEVPIH